jgi:hypothetical protein
MSSLTLLAVAFPWFKAGLVFLLAAVIASLLCVALGINPDTFQGLPIWGICVILFTIALLWLFRLITGHTVGRLLIWCLCGLAGFLLLILLLMFGDWLQERKSRRSKEPNGK